MNIDIRKCINDIYAADAQIQNQAFFSLLAASEIPVDWAYEIWDELLAGLKHKDNLVRAICAQVLCNLAKSDPKKRILRDFDALLAVTRDERFVTARHTLQAMWKIGAAGQEQYNVLVNGLSRRYHDCASEKNATLIRYDILAGLRRLYDHVEDETLREKAQELIALEADEKYRKKYARLWKK